jgi:hypothetical protein
MAAANKTITMVTMAIDDGDDVRIEQQQQQKKKKKLQNSSSSRQRSWTVEGNTSSSRDHHHHGRAAEEEDFFSSCYHDYDVDDDFRQDEYNNKYLNHHPTSGASSPDITVPFIPPPSWTEKEADDVVVPPPSSYHSHYDYNHDTTTPTQSQTAAVLQMMQSSLPTNNYYSRRRTTSSGTTASSSTPSIDTLSSASASASISSLSPSNNNATYQRRRGGRGSSNRSSSNSNNNNNGRIKRDNGTSTIAGSATETIDEEAVGGLKASLDAGMAAVRKWIRSRSRSHSQSSPSLSSTHTLVPTSSPRQEPDLMRDFLATTAAVAVASNSVTTMGTSSGHTHTLPPELTITPPTILEDEVGGYHNPRPAYHDNGSRWGTSPQTPPPPRQNPRQRAHSEPDATSIRDYLFQRALTPQSGGFRRRRYQSEMEPMINISSSHFQFSNDRQVSAITGTPQRLSPSAVEVLFSSTPPSSELIPADPDDYPARQHENLGGSGSSSSLNRQQQQQSSEGDNSITVSETDAQNQARARWLSINRQFQVVITVVALIFSLLLFCILICWIVLLTAFVASIGRPCDVPLKSYFWLVTAQVILDIYRTEILRLFFRWDTNSNQRIPCRVITYNAAYLMYAFAVLWLGIHSVYLQEDVTCRATAGQFFRSSKAFVTMSIAAWAVIFLGYVLPFCLVATLLTLNGYTPPNDRRRDPLVFPTPMGSPAYTMDLLRTVRFDEIPAGQTECSVCMDHFDVNDTIVKTECSHYYHRQCLSDWLSNARTCPVCRMDIPGALERRRNDQEDHPSSPQAGGHDTPQHGDDQHNRRMGIAGTFARNTDIHHEVMMMHHQIIRRTELRNRNTSTSQSVDQLRNPSGSLEMRNRSRSHSFTQHEPDTLEEGRER